MEHKFNIGDIVQVSFGNYGHPDSDMGKRVMITECGTYGSGGPGYRVYPELGNSRVKSGKYAGFNGEKSYTLTKKAPVVGDLVRCVDIKRCPVTGSIHKGIAFAKGREFIVTGITLGEDKSRILVFGKSHGVSGHCLEVISAEKEEPFHIMSEDRVRLYVNDKYWWIDTSTDNRLVKHDDVCVILASDGETTWGRGVKIFSSEQAAQEYKDKHWPPEPKLEFKPGWYIFPRDDYPYEGLIYIEKLGDSVSGKSYGLNRKNKWSIRYNVLPSNVEGRAKPASDEYVGKRLIEYAKEKYPVGTKFLMVNSSSLKSTPGESCKSRIIEGTSVTWFPKSSNGVDVLCCSGNIYAGGVWATIIDEPEEKIPEVKSKVIPLQSHEVECEACDGTGQVMVGKLYPSGHTEVMEDCPDCGGEGTVETEPFEEKLPDAQLHADLDDGKPINLGLFRPSCLKELPDLRAHKHSKTRKVAKGSDDPRKVRAIMPKVKRI